MNCMRFLPFHMYTGPLEHFHYFSTVSFFNLPQFAHFLVFIIPIFEVFLFSIKRFQSNYLFIKSSKRCVLVEQPENCHFKS